MIVTATKFRQNLYKFLDRVIKTGIPIEINRKGQKIKIIASDTHKSKLKNLKKHAVFNCGEEEIIHNDWSGEWNG